jgi:hypothetical protein
VCGVQFCSLLAQDKCKATFVGQVTEAEKKQRQRQRSGTDDGKGGQSNEDNDKDNIDLYAVLGLSQDGEEFPSGI